MKNNIQQENISLSSHLINKLNENNVNEGILSGLIPGGDSPSESQTGAAKGILGLLGTFAVKMGFIPEEDKVAKAISNQLEEAEKNANDRMQKYMDAKENALIAKMAAKFQHKENQLNLENQKKVDAFNRKKAEFDRETKFWKSNKTSFTVEENEAYDAKLEKNFKELGDLHVPELEEMRTLYLQLAYDDNNNPRDLAAIKKYAAENGKEAFERYNELAKKHGKKMLTAVTEMTNEGEYQTLMSDVFATADAEKNAKSNKESAENMMEVYKKNAEVVKTVNTMITEQNNKIDTAKKDKAEFDDLKTRYTGDDGFFSGPGDDGLVLKESELDRIIDECMKDLTDNPSEEDTKALKEKLEKMGIPADIATDIASGEEGVDGKKVDKIKAKAKRVITEKQDAILEQATSGYNEVKGKSDAADAELPGLEDSLQKMKNGESTADMSPEQKEALAQFKNIPKEDIETGRYDETTDAGKAVKTALEKNIKDADKAIRKIEHDQAALADERKERIALLKDSNKFSTEIKRKIEVEMQGVDAGETKNDKGKVGYYKDGKFIERPSINATKSERDEYNKGLKKMILTGDIKEPEIKSIEKTEDGKYKITWADGKVDEETDIDTVAYCQAQLSLYSQNKSLANAQREKFFKDNIDKVFTTDSDGKYKFNEEAFKELSKEDQEMVAMIMEDPESFTEGLEDRGENADKFSKMMDDDGVAIKKFIKEEGLIDLDVDVDDEDDTESAELRKSDDEIDSDEDDPENQGQKKKIKNPAKEWHKKKNKSTGKPTKNYYNKEGDSISPKEYKEKVQNYKERLAKKKNTATDQQSLNSIKANINESLSSHLKRSII